MININQWQERKPVYRMSMIFTLHALALWLYMVLVLGHWSEHVMQIYQVYVLGWLPKQAGGILGLWYPWLAAAEILHFVYNALQLAGLVALRPGIRGRARPWWNIALGAQVWHFFEHLLLQVQWLTGYYLFGASQQMGIGQLWFPRLELHFMYNLVVFLPTVIAVVLYFRAFKQDQENFD
ncbi:MAG TPA: hypothetical protein P5121_22320 [Caldilineaceae bacterium]|nr:hypothetical protein [Caldilineaceae bacterium]